MSDGNHTAEGPKFYKRDGSYWLFFPAGGVEQGWQVAARSDSPYGPYTARTVLAQGKTKINGPHQGAWVHTSADEDWFVHFSDRDAYGRIVYLEPMAWRADGWPVIGADADGDGCGEPVGEYAMPKGGSRDAQVLYPQLDDEFDAPRLGPQWQYLGRTKAQVGFPTTRGVFRLYSTPGVRKWLDDGAFANSMREVVNTWNTPNALVQKFPAFAFTATMKAQVGAKQDNTEAGLLVQGTSYARLGLRAKGESFDVVYTECLSADKGKDEKSRTVATVKAEAVEAGAGRGPAVGGDSAEDARAGGALHLLVFARRRDVDGRGQGAVHGGARQADRRDGRLLRRLRARRHRPRLDRRRLVPCRPPLEFMIYYPT